MQEQLTLTVTLGGAVEECVARSLNVWRRQHAASKDLEAARLEDTLLTVAQVKLLGFGRLGIAVTVKARRPWESETYWYRYQVSGDNEYTLQGSA